MARAQAVAGAKDRCFEPWMNLRRDRTKVRFGVVEAINGNICMLINRGRGYKNMRYLLLKAKRMAVTNTEYGAFQKTRKAA